MTTERENIATIQAALATIKAAAREEIARAQKSGDARLINAWGKVYHSTGTHHGYLADLLIENYPDFAAEVIERGPGGR